MTKKSFPIEMVMLYIKQRSYEENNRIQGTPPTGQI